MGTDNEPQERADLPGGHDALSTLPAIPPRQAPRLTLRKHERLHHETVINALFAQGEKIFSFPLRAVYTISPIESPTSDHGARYSGGIRALFIAQKRLFKKATQRNRVKRQMRENLRIRITPLRESLRSQNQLLTIALIAIDAKTMEHARCGSAMERILNQIARNVEKSRTTADNSMNHRDNGKDGDHKG